MKKYFVYEPVDNQFDVFESEAERDEYASKIIESFKNDIRNEWSEEVEGIVCGIITKKATAVNIKKRPENLEDGYDKDGNYWPEGMDLICDYEMVELKL